MYLTLSIILMAAVTYLIRALPLCLFNKQIRSPWIKSFLHYMPYAVLASMTIPAIFYSTSDIRSAICGLIAGSVLAFFNRGLMLTAAGAVAAVYIAELFL
jgi:branched-subunit amino acid transport protein